MKKYIIFLLLVVLQESISAQNKTNNNIVISEIMYDTPLNEVITVRPYSNGEYIELYNCGRVVADLTGWQIKGDGSTETYSFPSGTFIAGRGFLIVAYQYTGSGFILSELFPGVSAISPKYEVLYQKNIVLANGGETVKLIDNKGVVRDQITYDGTSNKTKPGRLEAKNENGMPGQECVSLHRIQVDFDASQCAIAGDGDWITGIVSPFETRLQFSEVEPSASENYIQETRYIDTGGIAVDRITYYDGGGRPCQVVNAEASPNGACDLVSVITCDNMDRETIMRLPYPDEKAVGIYRPDAIFRQQEWYKSVYPGETTPYTETVFEAPSSNRIRAHYNVGAALRAANAHASHLYSSNKENEVQNIILSNNTYLQVSGYVSANTLYKDSRTDESGRTTITYTNHLGQTVLVRAIDRSDPAQERNADTYYIYDLIGRLAAVITPEGVKRLGSGIIPSDSDLWKNYGYLYQYDGRHNVVCKRLPGSGYQYFVYNDSDLVVASQDAVLQKKGLWLIYDYDAQLRLHKECLVASANTQSQMQDLWKSHGETALFNNPSCQVQRMYLYDGDYGSDLQPEFATVEGITTQEDMDNRVKGLKTYEKLAVLENTTGEVPMYIERKFYYDKKGRLIQTVERNIFGSVTRISNKYDFTGNIIATKEQVGDEVKLTTYSYDKHARLLKETAVLNDSRPVVTTYIYDAVGKLSGQSTDCLTENLGYNVQGWLTKKSVQNRSNDELFVMKLRYYDPLHPKSVPQHGGNIAEWSWRNGIDMGERSYAFAYDGLSRLTGAAQYKDGLDCDRFTEKGISYDNNGNMLTLQRIGEGVSKDYFRYSYTGNRLDSLNDGLQNFTYTYDVGGNMVCDGANSLDLTYNRLNLIEKVERGGQILAKYSYLSDGTKTAATDANGNGLMYAGSLVFERRNGVLYLESCAFSGGRFVAATSATGNTFTPLYYVSDHLGSTRVVVDSCGVVQERNDYYPFGLRYFPDGSAAQERYLFNGKETQDFVRLPYMDFGARMMDSKYTVRWNGLDPLAERYYSSSPYGFCLQNPLKYIDPDGKTIWINYYNTDGNKQRLHYMPNMSNTDDNSFASNIITNLNAVYSNGGSSMMDLLINSSNDFSFVDEKPTKGFGAFRANTNGGGTIFAANVEHTNFNSVEMVSHEMFHALQCESNQGGFSVYNEIEAYVYGNSIATNWRFATTNFQNGTISSSGNGTKAGQVYEAAFEILQYNEYSPAVMRYAMNTFKTGASVNQTGIYNSAPRYPKHNGILKPLLHIYRPSIRF